MERLLITRKTGCGTTERERETDGQTERERGREVAVLCEKEGTSMIDVDNVETTRGSCCHLS